MTDRREALEAIDAPSARDATRATAIAILSALPLIGGPLTAYMDQYLPQQQQKRVIEMLGFLSVDLDRMGDKVDAGFVRKDEYAGFFEECVEQAKSRRSEGKRRLYAAALANATTDARPDEEERFRMLATLDALRPSPLRLLSVIASHRQPSESLRNAMVGSVMQVISELAPDLPEATVRDDWSELSQQRLAPDYPSGMMTGGGVGSLYGRLTPYGQRFVAFIAEPD